MSLVKDWCFNKAASCSQASVYREKEGGYVTPHGQGCPMHSVPGSNQTSLQSLSSTRSSRTLLICASELSRGGCFQHKLPHNFIIHYRTLILFGKSLFPCVGSTWVGMWKCLSSTSLCSAGSRPSPWSGMQCREEGECQPLAWLSWAAHLYLSAHTSSQAAVRSLSPYCTGAVAGGSGKTQCLKLSQLTPF